MSMQKRIVLVHGIYSKEGQSSVWNMKAPLEKATGLPVEVFEYGYLHAIQARFENPSIAKRLAHILEPGDIVVNHSNGAAVTYLATVKEGARPSGVVMINPALDTWRLPVCDWAHIYYNAEDEVVWWSQLLIGNVWGDMGQVGFCPEHDITRIGWPQLMETQLVDGVAYSTSVRQADTIKDAQYLAAPPARGHLAMFQSPCVEPWGRIVGRKILSEITR